MTTCRGARTAGQGGQPGARHRVHDVEERRAAHRGRPAARAGGRDPGRERRRPRRGRGPAAWRRVRSTACGSPTRASKAWPTACAPSRRCPTRSARCSTAGRGPNGLEISRVRVPLGVVAIIYENRPTSRATRPGCASSRATRCCSAARRRRCGRTSRSPRSSATRSPSTACPRTRSSSSRTRATRRPPRSCSSRSTSTA